MTVWAIAGIILISKRELEDLCLFCYGNSPDL
jgi:hypothetical protein